MSSRELLNDYVTNVDGDVFAIKNLQGMVGAVMARYSRAEGGLRDTLLNEFVKEDQLNAKKASQLIKRVLIAYGDDSVGELEGAHLSFENISMLATKVVEHRRIGGSPIEQSTRYVRYDFKDEKTGYHYFHPESLRDGDSGKIYRKHMNRIFDIYSEMWAPLMDYITRQKPIEDAEYDLGEMGSKYSEMKESKHIKAFERTYKNDIKTKVCDIMRAFLPLATRANVGLFGNGRYFQHLISKMLTSPLKEANELGGKAFEELSKLIPHYVRRATRMDYVVENEEAMFKVAAKYFGGEASSQNRTVLIEPDNDFIAQRLSGNLSGDSVAQANREEAELSFLASLLYAYVKIPFISIREKLKTLPASAHQEIMNAYYGERKARRNRPERGIEFGYPYNFDMVTEWAVYKDLMRHRMGTIMVQPLGTELGFEMPEEIEGAGLTDLANEAVRLSEELFGWLSENHPDEKEYAVMQGHRIRWFIGMNDRALMHMLELRTAPQGHINYRLACQEMHKLAMTRFPERAKRMSFVNHEEIYWARGDSEAAQRRKEAMLDQ